MPFIEYSGKRILFIHIPKTGGTSVENWMQGIAPLRLFSQGIPAAMKCTPQHLRMQDIRALLGEGYFDQALTVVRNPYDRIASEYRMRAHLAKAGFFKGLPIFSLWLEEWLNRQKREPFCLDNHLRPQWEFLGSEVETFRFEDGLQAPLARMAEWLDIAPPESLPHDLRPDPLEIAWDQVDRIRVRDHYARDFEMLGYSTR
ncbi:Sulfotransferase family protein [Paracoccus thiocyanatus]|uniref:Sulfotransferase family protein n=1 Tax=Paracoccus thiocyanatus TaxID=34006 RepID=A0A1N6RZJ9_9RHOB|nr:sulfotransferase family 2 domain-containing protein [Paracoccus thiocyanatus]SIQ34284.1 Sulfotransferase family protein [Paracoccus thiocyanatus]